jgi:hypothetical protein
MMRAAMDLDRDLSPEQQAAVVCCEGDREDPRGRHAAR